MYQIIPIRYLALAAAWVTVTIIFALSSITSLAVIPDQARYAVLIVDILLLVLTLKPVWRFLWRAIPLLNNWFPDLNGEYDVELRHNWPIQQRMLDAAAGRAEKFDPLLQETVKPDFGKTEIRASIDLSFYWVRVKMWSHNPSNPAGVIENSRTLATNLIRACDGQPNRIAYIYQQKNRRDRLAVTDDTVFEGAALLSIEADGGYLNGEYWTNRAWQKGLSTAGQIIFRRRGYEKT